MREKENQLLEIIRGSRDPEAVLAVAMAAVTDCQRRYSTVVPSTSEILERYFV